MEIDRLIDHDFFTYLIIGAMILSIISLAIITTIIFRRKQKQSRLKIIVSIGMLLLSAAFIIYYYYPTVIKFQTQVSQDYSLNIYTTRPNATGGITMKKYEIDCEEYAKIINGLGNARLLRQIVDWNISERDTIKYDLLIMPLTSEPDGIYLNEMRLYVKADGKYQSYIVALKDGRKRTYQIRDMAEIEKLIAELKSFTDSRQ